MLTKTISQGVTSKRGQIGWQVERLPIHGCRIVDNTGRIIAADVYDEELAEQIVAEHASHAALVVERERLRAVLQYVGEVSERQASKGADDSDTVNITVTVGWLREVAEALATGEQGGEE